MIKAWTKESKNKIYKGYNLTTVDGLPNIAAATAEGTQATRVSDAIFDLNFPIQRSNKELIFQKGYANYKLQNPKFAKKLNDYFDLVIMDKRGFDVQQMLIQEGKLKEGFGLVRTATGEFAKAGSKSMKGKKALEALNIDREVLDFVTTYMAKDSPYFTRTGGENIYDILGKHIDPEKVATYRNKINVGTDQWRKNLDEVVELANKGVHRSRRLSSAQLVYQMKKESQNMAKLFGLKDLPKELKYFGYSQDHLLGIREALESGDPRIARQTLKNTMATTRAQNTFLGFKEFGNQRRQLMKDFNAAPKNARGPIIKELNTLSEKFMPGKLKYNVRKSDGSMKIDILKKEPTFKARATAYEKITKTLPKDFKSYLKNSRNKTAAEAQAKLFQKLGIDAPCSNLVAGGGRIGFATKTCGLELARRKPSLFLELAADEKYQKIIQGMDPNKVKSAGRGILKNMRKLGYANPFSWIGGEVWYVGLDAWASKTKGTPLLESLDNAFIFYNFDEGRKNFEKVAEDMGYSDLQMDALRETINLAQTGQEQEKQERVLGNLESTQQEYMQPHPSYRDPDKPILPPGMEAMAVKKTDEQISSQQKVLQDLEEKSTLGWTNLLKNVSKQKGLDPEMFWRDLTEKDLDQTFADIYKTAETVKRKELQSLGEEKYTEKGEQFDPYASPFGSWVYGLFGDKDKEKNYLTWDQLQDQNVPLPKEAMQELYGRGWFGKNIYKDLSYLFEGADGGRAGYMGGGIAGIRKPSAIAPTGGPMSQGLRSLYNNVKKS